MLRHHPDAMHLSSPATLFMESRMCGHISPDQGTHGTGKDFRGCGDKEFLLYSYL